MPDPRIMPGANVDLAEFDCAHRLSYDDKSSARKALARASERLDDLSARLGATRAKAVLVVLQGMDGCGKDGTTRVVLGAVNPILLRITSFKAPTPVELGHDFLWRIHAALPQRGEIGVFNRSHYEDVLVVRVDELVPEAVWSRRYDAINAFERHLVNEGTIILKFFLHVSLEAQKERFEERLHDPAKAWKFSPDDLKKRSQWNEYMQAYEAMLEQTSTEWAPWYVVPSDRNDVRNAFVAETLVAALDDLDLDWPALDPEVARTTIT